VNGGHRTCTFPAPKIPRGGGGGCWRLLAKAAPVKWKQSLKKKNSKNVSADKKERTKGKS
jgi:hypothetical protein